MLGFETALLLVLRGDAADAKDLVARGGFPDLACSMLVLYVLLSGTPLDLAEKPWDLDCELAPGKMVKSL